MKKYFSIFKQTFQEFGQDKAARLGAALAYYTIFSIGPLFLIAISLAGIVWGRQAAQGKISTQLNNVLGSNAAEAVETMITAASDPRSGIIAAVIGMVMLLFGASGVFAQLKDALNTIRNVPPKKSLGVMGFIKDRFLSMAMVLGIGFLLLVTLIFDAAISAMGDYFGRVIGGEATLQVIHQLLSFGLITLLFALIFRVLPDLDIAWRDVWFGALFTALLFVVGKLVLGLYLGKAAVGSSYGAAGSLVVLLLWVYYSAQILFFGAEFTQVYARRLGSREGDTSKSEARAVAGRVEDRPRKSERGRPEPRAPQERPRPGSRSRGALVAGGAAGLVAGVLLGGVTALVVTMKAIKRAFMMPFR